MSWQAKIITLLPEAFPGVLDEALAGRARAANIWSLDVIHLREFGHGRHRSVDDTPAGGGAGMVIRADVAASAIDAARQDHENLPVLALSPRGKTLTQAYVRELAAGPGVILFCARFEGLDERVLHARNVQEISIGDYILSGGEAAALCLLDAVIRLLPGVMGEPQSAQNESFEDYLLEYPHYTRPALWEGHAIPDVLASGDHARIAEWRQEQAERLTKTRRPDLWQKYCRKYDRKHK